MIHTILHLIISTAVLVEGSHLEAVEALEVVLESYLVDPIPWVGVREVVVDAETTMAVVVILGFQTMVVVLMVVVVGTLAEGEVAATGVLNVHCCPNCCCYCHCCFPPSWNYCHRWVVRRRTMSPSYGRKIRWMVPMTILRSDHPTVKICYPAFLG